MHVSSAGGGANLAALIGKVNTGQAQGAAVARLIKEQMQQEGQQTLQLIQSTEQTPSAGVGNVGKTIDVMA